jgi:hypothetical protein
MKLKAYGFLLTLAYVAMLSGARGLYAIAQFGRDYGAQFVRNMRPGDDHCRVRSGAAPQILAAFRNAVIALLNAAGSLNKAASLRRHAAQPSLALALVHDTS